MQTGSRLIDSVKVIVLTGGLGTRLRGTIGDLPKSLAPIAGKPFLEYLVKVISAQGFRDIVLCCGHRAGLITNHFGDGSRFGVSISYTIEEKLLGTGGAVKLAETLIDSDDFIVTNGDTYLEVDLNDMLGLHRSQGALATMALVRKEDTGRYGRVVLGGANQIVAFNEKAVDGKAGLINGGMYVFRKEIFDFIPAGKVCSLEREVLPLLIDKGFCGFASNGYFIDIGIPEDYERAKKELPQRRVS